MMGNWTAVIIISESPFKIKVDKPKEIASRVSKRATRAPATVRKCMRDKIYWSGSFPRDRKREDKERADHSFVSYSMFS
jgi:hypothetical protein